MTQKELSLVLIVLGFSETEYTEWRIAYGKCRNFVNKDVKITFSQNSLETNSTVTQWGEGYRLSLLTEDCATVAAKLANMITD